MNVFTALRVVLLLAVISSVGVELHAQSAGRNLRKGVYLDGEGVIRWNADHEEVALFGANYSLASACDYRAAGYLRLDRKQLVEKDLTHFVRMGWDAIRLCFWGDWENSDAKGNLIANDHLDVLDYAIAEAGKRGIGILFTPITTYSSLWPDGKDSPEIIGFSKAFKKSALGTDPAAIAAQCNYLRQILYHVNPYTGVALKDDPAILFIEMINEPDHHSDDFSGSVAYINALAEAVRSTGCKKLLFHNLSQDFKIAPAIRASSVPGMTFAWYPTGLNSGHELTENYLRSVDHYTPMGDPSYRRSPKIVYEFDSADMNSGYMYPAMVRAFREAGAQFATMFSYDMVDTAPYNLGWQTHFLNLVYSPKKAASAIIAAEAMRQLPRYSHFGEYPQNCTFGAFRVSYAEDRSELVTKDTYYYANGSDTAPPEPNTLRRIAGTGSSAIVSYPGNGLYFLDRIEDGVWRLEVYPDALTRRDPFSQQTNFKDISVRLIARSWPMTLRVPGLGTDFFVTGLNHGNALHSRASGGQFSVEPGVYLLSHDADRTARLLPETIARVGLKDFVCPASVDLGPEIYPEQDDVSPSSEGELRALFASEHSPDVFTAHVRAVGETHFKESEMKPVSGYTYAAALPRGIPPDQTVEYYFTAKSAGNEVRFPVREGEFLSREHSSGDSDLTLLSGSIEGARLAYTRIGDTVRRGIFKNLPPSENSPAALRLLLPLDLDPMLEDYTASLSIKKLIRSRPGALADRTTLKVKARASTADQSTYITLVEADGTSWSAPLALSPEWREITLPLRDLKLARSAMLPLGYPGQWNYWSYPAQGRGLPGDSVSVSSIEHVQLSLRKTEKRSSDRNWVDIASIALSR